eukprot:11186891-Lingulodinium_polyedra.AAC.1
MLARPALAIQISIQASTSRANSRALSTTVARSAPAVKYLRLANGNYEGEARATLATRAVRTKRCP